ncbi:hypothetical protein NL676_034103 [Syzygium grande]|nr:hypothetical protein NL676_034103 [Syzygium grande]
MEVRSRSGDKLEEPSMENHERMEVTSWKSHPWVGPRRMRAMAIHNPNNNHMRAAVQHVDSSDHRLARLAAVMDS